MREGRDARRRRARLAGRQATWLRVTAAASSAALLGTLGLAGTSMAATAKAAKARDARRHHQHVVVPPGQRRQARGGDHLRQRALLPGQPERPVGPGADAEPAQLLRGQRHHALANNHTPLIAHTADDILTTLTGLYGDRQGMPISNDYQAYNTDGPNGSFNTTDSAGSFAYWTDPVYDTASTPSPAHDTNPNMVYAPVPPATATTPVTPNTITPAPWVPFTRAGCDVGDVARRPTQELENTHGGHPEGVRRQLTRSPAARPPTRTRSRTRRSPTTSASPCTARRAARSARAPRAVKYGQTSATPTAVTDSLPNEPGGYTGFQALFGAQVRRAAARRGHAEHDPQRLRGDQRRRQPGRPERQPDQRRVPHQPPRVPRLRPHRLADAGVHGRHARVRRSRRADLHRGPARAARASRPWTRRATPATTSRTRSAAAPVLHRPGAVLQRTRSARSSSGWRPTASRRRTRCSSSAPTRATTRPAPTSAGPSSPPRPTATA